MTLFRSEPHSLKHVNMTGESRCGRPRAGSKRSSSEMYRSDQDQDYDCYSEPLYGRVFDYQRVPVSMATILRNVSPPKRPRSSTSSSPSSSALHRSRERLPLQHRSRISGNGASTAKLRIEELQRIKRELMVIKGQIDELLDSLDDMDRQRRDHSEGSVKCSPYRSGGGTSGSPRGHSPLDKPHPPRERPHPHRESPEPGEASDDNSSQMSGHSSDFEYV